tara:strand:- start:118 stop:1017 length:900 start_codon:yes stop_codon:yes gene_type:complete
MKSKKDIACVVYYTDSRYDGLVDNVKNSFLNFNGEECDYYQVDYTNQEDFNKNLEYFEFAPETFLMQYIYAYEIMKKHNYKKVIILGSDTIVCGRLDEFLDDNSTPVLATLNYPCQESTEYWTTPMINIPMPDGSTIADSLNINADVACFNNSDALKKVIELSIEHYTHYSIQGGMNELAWSDKSYDVKVVDSPYPLSKVSYNCRSKGVFGTDMIVKGKLAKHGHLDGQPSPILNWYVKDNKLFTSDNKQIKVFHFVEGLGGRPDEKFYELLEDFKTTWFNKQTLDFFKNKCGCIKFFN